MRALLTLLALLTSSATVVRHPPTFLQVLRVSPSDNTGEPTSTVTVTFDKPVAGQLDATIDARRIFSIVPAVAGTVEWRDPITLRFRPAAPLRAGATYTVTIANTFTAMDGARLQRPYRYSFRVGGPRVLYAGPADPRLDRRYLRPDVQFAMVLSSPVDLALVPAVARLELDRTCSLASPVALRATSQRALTARDPSVFREAGGWQRDKRHDRLRRLVRLAPAQPLPNGCEGRLSVPARIDAGAGEARGDMTSDIEGSFAIFGPLRLEDVQCGWGTSCPAGWARVKFSTPVRGSEVLRGVHIAGQRFEVSDTTAESPWWNLEVALRARTSYTITVDSTLRDIFGQTIGPVPARTLTTTGYEPSLSYDAGSMLVERQGFRTIAVRHVNVDTVYATFMAVPESLEARFLAAPRWNLDDALAMLAGTKTTRAIPVRGARDVPLVSAVRVPAYNAARGGGPTLTAITLKRTRADTGRSGGVIVTQVTNLGIAARLGVDEATAWVTRVNDGTPVAGAEVSLYGRNGRVRAKDTTDAQGLARMTALPPEDSASDDDEGGGFEGYMAAAFESDRAVVAFDNYSWELNPWRFNVPGAWGNQRLPAAGAVFTERGIYRPGETVYAKAIVRTGNLGALRVPARRDSLRWTFYDREDGTMRDTIVTPSAFGTTEQSLRIPADLALGTYRVAIALRRNGAWVNLADATYRIAEYRPPEFLVGVAADTTPRFPGDTLTATVEARYLFGAPMARAAVSWMVRRATLDPWAISIPGADDWTVGETGWWWEDYEERSGQGEVVSNATDTLDATGHFPVRVRLGPATKGRAARVTVQATVTDVNRQTVSSSTSMTVHPAAFYIAARTIGDEYFWRANTPQRIAVKALTPSGGAVPGVAIHGTLVRQEWHAVNRSRAGVDEEVGGWVPDTVGQCDITTPADTSAAPAECGFTPARGGSYVVSFRARDAARRPVSTSFFRWATGRGWVPWGDETQLKMDLIPDHTRYDVGDTATILIASPFTDAEAWLTVEREGLIEQRRMRLTSGATSVKIPLTEAHVPNAFVSVVVVRGRTAAPGGIADAGRPALRVGYTQLQVQPSVKRLTVEVQPLAIEYRPGDSARVRLAVRDAQGAGRRSEVTLWAVDEGVLALTGYRTPDPVDLIYQPRGVSLRLRSDLVSVAAQVLEQEGVSIKGEQEPGGGGGQAGADILRSRFASTAFFLGSVVTDSSGVATATAKLPDNLTTFRVMAVAVTAGDRYGSGQSSMLVTRPLLARPALPRFLRRDDHFVAGVVVNQRSGAAAPVRVRAAARGVTLADSAVRTVTLDPSRGREVRFAFRDTTADTASFRFDVGNGRDSDAVLTRLPVRPSHTPRAWTAAGVARGTAPVELALPADIDPERSTLTFSIGTTPLAVIGGMYRQLALYPFDCTEQISSELMPIIALYRAGSAAGAPRLAPADARRKIEEGVAVLTRRQRADGGIGLWSADDWTTPWLSAYAGEALLAARAAGIPVRDTVLARLGDYLFNSVHQWSGIQAPVASWFDMLPIRFGEDVAAVDFLSQLGRPDVPGENDLYRRSALMAWEDRARLAEVLVRRGALPLARNLMEPMWARTRVEGRRAVLPDSAYRSFYFRSTQRPASRLLSATLAVDSTHALIGPLVETLVQQSRARAWNTQDYGAAVQALADFTTRQSRAARRGFTVTANGQEIYRAGAQGEFQREISRNLAGLLVTGADGRKTLPISVASQGGAALFYYVTVDEVPLQRPVTPDQQGVQVERWYEDYNTGRPIQTAVEGSLVRVRLRVRFTAARNFLALTDPLPAGLEAVDLSLRTTGTLPGPAARRDPAERTDDEGGELPDDDSGYYRYGWYYGSWDSGWWSPFDHRELRDDRVVYVATHLWPGTYTATYVARATTPGVFIRPPAHAEEMYNPAVQGRSDGGTFTVTPSP